MSTQAILAMELKPYHEKYREQVVFVWEKSVRATHHFVTADDIIYFKQIVQEIDFYAFDVYCLMLADRLIGFIGVAGKSIEMFFLDPDFTGQGLGDRLMRFALEDLKATKVDVNEQNTNAVKFYAKYGFVTYKRTEKDPEGKAYPILKMKLKKINNL
jgi:putative acetyltransferase